MNSHNEDIQNIQIPVSEIKQSFTTQNINKYIVDRSQNSLHQKSWHYLPLKMKNKWSVDLKYVIMLVIIYISEKNLFKNLFHWKWENLLQIN